MKPLCTTRGCAFAVKFVAGPSYCPPPPFVLHAPPASVSGPINVATFSTIVSRHSSASSFLCSSSPPASVSSPTTARPLSTRSHLGPHHFLASPTILPTFHFQRSLPRLPIPELSASLDRYLAAQRPLLDDASYAATERLARDFAQNEGESLQAELQRRDAAAKHTSYISGWWFDSYLRDRAPLPLNYNPFIGFVDDDSVVSSAATSGTTAQLIRSVNFLVSSARFYNSLTTERLDPEMYHLNSRKSDNERTRRMLKRVPRSVAFYGAYLMKIFPLDMSQYGNLFHSTREPRKGQDVIVKHSPSRHVVVLRRGRFYSMPILKENGEIVDASTLLVSLKSIIDDPSPAPEYPVAALTTTHRDRWAALRDALVASGDAERDATNAESLRQIDSALFCLCLDDAAPLSDDDRLERLSLSDLFLHGVDGVNRWFDKSFSLIVCANGKAGINFEHSWGDGVAVLRYFNEIFDDSTNRPVVRGSGGESNVDDAQPDFRELEFRLSDSLKSEVIQIRSEFLATVASLKTNLLIYHGVGRKQIKSFELSPDGVFQLAFQMAYYRLTGKIGATYESCSTAAFKHGRTETLRPATIEARDCCVAMSGSSGLSKTGVNSYHLELIKKASKKHGQLTKEAAMGQGFDRHLFALRKIAEERVAEGNESSLPAFYLDESYAGINRNVLSTSTLGAIGAKIGGFAPTCEEGLGIGYMLVDDMIGCNVTSYVGKGDVDGYLECLRACLDDIFDVLRKGDSSEP